MGTKIREIAYILSPGLMKPDECHKTINTINISSLKKYGIRNIIFDADGTLAVYHNMRVHPNVLKKFIEFKRNFRCCILSNSSGKTDNERKNNLRRNLDIPVVDTQKRKPNQLAFDSALKLLRANSSTTAIIGDRIMTDITGGNKKVLYTILVRSLEPDKDPLELKIMSLWESVVMFVLGVKMKK